MVPVLVVVECFLAVVFIQAAVVAKGNSWLSLMANDGGHCWWSLINGGHRNWLLVMPVTAPVINI